MPSHVAMPDAPVPSGAKPYAWDPRLGLSTRIIPGRPGGMYTVTGLSAGTHTLAIEVTYTWNSLSTGAWVGIDAFEVTP